MQISLKKTALTIVMLFLIVFCAITLLLPEGVLNEISEKKANEHTASARAIIDNREKDNSKISTGNVSTKTTNRRPDELIYTEAEWYDFQLWKRERGYPLPEDEEQYSSYDVATLSNLAANGDIFAMQELGTRAYNQEIGNNVQDSVEFALSAYRDAAVRGSTYALTWIGDQKLSGVGSEENNKKRMEMIVEGLAWYRVAVKRGDLSVQDTHIGTFKSINNVSLTKEQKRDLKERTKEIFENLQRKRIDLGLGNYDNAINDMQKTLHSNQNQL